MLRIFYKKNFQFLRPVLSAIIAFQLAVQPYMAKALPPSQKTKDSLSLAERFNKDHVESLRELVFGSKGQTADQHYKNHPLDIFSLLGQNVYITNKLGAGFTNKVRNIFLKLLQDEEIKTHQADLYKQVEKLNEQKDLSDPDFLTKKLKPFLEQITDRNNPNYQPDVYLSSVKILEKLNSTGSVKAENIIVRVVEDTEKKDLKAVLSHPDQTSIAQRVLSPEELNQFQNSSFKSDTKKKLSIQLYHHDQIIHSLPQNIQWIAFFNNYLVFLEPSKVSDEKALISFIDLTYFEPALGRTALPLFFIPVHFKETGISKEELLFPKSLELQENSRLLVGDMKLSLGQMDYISILQQLNFNTTVSLTDPASANLSQEYLREIVHQFEGSFSDSVLAKNNSDTAQTDISQKTKQMILKMLEHRKSIGSSQDASGPYGKLNKTLNQLSLSAEESPVTKDFKDSLTQDKSFQASVEAVSKNINREQKFYTRWFAFLNHISRPQPLGSPKIERALGLIANSVSLKGDTVSNRLQTFKEALSQFFYPKKNRFLTAGFLGGMGLIASPESAGYFAIALGSMGSWFNNWGELVTATLSAGFEWVSADGLYNSYLKGDNSTYLMKGLVSLFAVSLAFIGSFHLGVNLHDLKQARKSPEYKNFISYMEKNRSEFYENLSNAEKKKLGIIIDLQMGLKNIHSQQLLKTSSQLSALYSALESQDQLDLEITIQKGKQTVVLNLKPEPLGTANDSLKENQISLSLSHANQKIIRVWTAGNGNLKQLLNEEKTAVDPHLSMNVTLSGKDFHTDGLLQNADFTNEENERLNQILSEIEIEEGKALLESEADLSKKQITSLKQALAHLSLGYSSWAKTFRFTGLSWNWFFFTRSIYISPTTMAKLLYYSKYFKVNVEDGHLASFFNGGRENRFSRLRTVFSLKSGTEKNLRESFQSLKEFENKMIKIERQILEEVSAQAYLELVKQAGEEGAREIQLLSKGPDLTSHDIKNKKLRIFHGVYKRELFKESMRAYLLKLAGINDFDIKDESLKRRILLQLAKGDLHLPDKLKKEEIRALVQQVDTEKKIAQNSRQAVNHLLKGFLKRLSNANEQTGRDTLDAKRNLQMERMSMAKKMLNDPEALARATRQQLTSFLIDKPIELLYTFIFLAGVDQGILQILHDKAFTEEAWFHLSRYAIWSGFFSSIVLEVLGGSWMKVQQDARLDEQRGFDILPDQKDINKKFAFLRWFKKQFMAQDNTLKENYKYSWRIIIANLSAAFLTIAIIHFSTLGRFDLELFISVYLIILFPILALDFKMENAFEKSANWSLKDLIKKGLDLKGGERRFLSHPAVQSIKIKESQKLRIKYNFLLALIYDNPVGNLVNIFQNIGASTGSRAFFRQFAFGGLATEYWVNFMDFLENKNLMSSGIAEKCKGIFANNRTDL